ncbi:cytochrome C oxidase subunit IV family protein [Haloferula sargassicola]|uniref:Cytochrome c oxidase subunit 4 n=1 Tax=Haloferula sargassicola TaxID=490096 RepID=A0ABP9UN58_9BACT
MADSVEHIKKATRLYLIIGAALFAGTIATVLVATVPALDFGRHGFDSVDMILGLLIATTKASLVAAIFMHLNHEKKAIYWLFASGLAFAFFMVFLIFWAKADPIHYDRFSDGGQAAAVLSPTEP